MYLCFGFRLRHIIRHIIRHIFFHPWASDQRGKWWLGHRELIHQLSDCPLGDKSTWQHVMKHQVRLRVSRVGGSVTMQARWGRLGEGERAASDGRSADTDTTSDHTWWWGILTKNTPPSTFRARLPVTLAESFFYSSERIPHIFTFPPRDYLWPVIVFAASDTSTSTHSLEAIKSCRGATTVWSNILFKGLRLQQTIQTHPFESVKSMNNSSHTLGLIHTSVLWSDPGSVNCLSSLNERHLHWERKWWDWYL